MRKFGVAGIGAAVVTAAAMFMAGGGVQAADLPGALPTKAPPPVAQASYDWTGFYLGGHIGYALGASNWSAPGLNGSLDFSNAYNFSSGTGSYLLGFQAGYDTVTASRWLFGIGADISIPSFVGGNQSFSSAPTGTANYLERVEFSGTVLGRLGYAPGPWLFYATGGFAWSYDQFTRTQLAGVPAGGTAAPGTVENLYARPRAGGAVGAGVEFALPAHWTAQLQYLFVD
jgi:high affinity Mn2+ porin